MLSFDAQGAGRGRRPRPVAAQAEVLEARELLAFTPLGFSLPDLAVSGIAAPTAAYGGSLGVQIDVRNLGASTIPEPLNLRPGDASRADAPATTVAVFLSPRPRLGAGSIKLGEVAIPAVLQNSLQRVEAVLPMPLFRPRGFPANGGRVYVFLQADPNGVVRDTDRTNNRSRVAAPVQIAAGLPDLETVALGLPAALRPGDTVTPVIKVANLGTVNSNQQGPVIVQLVASTDTNFGPGDSVLATYTIDNIPPLSAVAVSNTVLGDVNVTDPVNIRTLIGPQVTLPVAPSSYFVGVIVDPFNTIREIGEANRGASSALEQTRRVSGPADFGTPTTTGVLTDPAPAGNVFPIPAFGLLDTFGNPATTTTTTVAAASASSADRVQGRVQSGLGGGQARVSRFPRVVQHPDAPQGVPVVVLAAKARPAGPRQVVAGSRPGITTVTGGTPRTS